MTDNYDWNKLADAAEAGELRPIAGETTRGDEAAASGRAFLLAATGAGTIEDATRIALGRPRLDEERSETVLWRVRATAGLDGLVAQLAEREGLTRSGLIRAAVAEYARTHIPA